VLQEQLGRLQVAHQAIEHKLQQTIQAKEEATATIASLQAR
jgi:hypothetical protein